MALTPTQSGLPESETAFSLEAMLELVREPLQAAEACFMENTRAPLNVLQDISRHLRLSGGKRIRPALVLLMAGACEAEHDGLVPLAAVVEMVHSATLVHDDIIDGAETRRGQPSANTRWGNSRCVLAGDWLYMQAFRVALAQRDLEVLDALIALTQRMVEGELQQLEMVGRVVGPAEHVELMARKTADLFAFSCGVGPLLARKEREVRQAAERYGYHLGMAFQMVDDLLDFTSTAERLGKPVGNDLREGKMTLPALYAYERASADERRRFVQVMEEGEYRAVEFGEIRAILERHNALERARQEAEHHARLAERCLESLTASRQRAALAHLPQLLLARQY